jgi:tetratricopeptide (TPR) repeat protein
MGCLHQEVVKSTTFGSPTPEPATLTTAAKPFSKEKRQPKPETCVAFANFHQQLAIDPERSQAERDHSREKARKAYEHALQLDPDNLQALVGLGQLYDSTGDHARAVATYQQALKNHGMEPALWHRLGMSHGKAKDWDQSLQCLRKAVELEPENHFFVKTLGFGLARAGHFDEGFETLKMVMGEAEAHYNLAGMLRHMNQSDSSRQHLEAALQLNPQMGKARQMLADLQPPTAALGAVPASYHELEPR